ncbi:MAG: cation diffusion facilitator family transporter [Bacteroidales bacterium]
MHYHKPQASSQEKRLADATAANIGIALAEVAGGLLSGSLALLSDAIHNLADTLSLVISYIAIRLSQRQHTEKHTFGLRRSEILAAFINSSLLIAISSFLILEAFQRWLHPREINFHLMGWIALAGLIGNLAGMLLLHGIHKESVNIRSAYLHLLGDTVSSVAVIGGAIIMAFTGWHFVDPLLTIIISLYIGYEALHILRNAVSILLMAAPPGIDIQVISQKIRQVDGISDIHHIHIWRLDDNTIHFEAHFRANADMSLKQADLLRVKAEEILTTEFGIAHVTLQIEPKDHDNGCGNSLIEPEFVKH